MTKRRASVGAVVATALGLLFSVSAPAAPPTLTVEATDAVIGEAIRATAELAESPGASGEISLEVFASDDPTCTGPALDQSSVTVNGEGEYNSKNFKPTIAGDYYWTARYSGDEGGNEPAEAICAATSTVAKASPEMTGNASSGVVGTAIHDEVTLTGGFSPGGEVTFAVYGPKDTNCETPLETSAATVESDEAVSDDFVPQQTGEFRWSASYEGDANNEPFSLECEADGQTSSVAKASPGLTATATSTVVVGNTITDKATISGGFSPGGQIVFRAYGPGDATCGDTAAYEATVSVNGNGAYSPAGFAPGPGLYRWTVEYKGDSDNGTASLGCNATGQSSTVTKASPGLTGSASSGVVGTAIHDEVTVTGGSSPGGEVTFKVYGPEDASCTTELKTMKVAVTGGKATSEDFLTQQAGEFRWTASYGGDANNEAVSLGCNASGQTSSVAKAAPGLAATATSTVVVGNTITDEATISGGFSPEGEIVFRAFGPGDATCGTTPAYEATVPVSDNGPYSPAGFAPGPGLYRWTVEYKGDSDNGTAILGCNASGQASAVGTIDVTLTASATGGTVGTPVTATATLKEGAIPGGQIVFKAFPPGDTNCSGAAAFSSTVSVAGNGAYRSGAFTPTRVGTFRWTTAYSGDPNHAPATVGCGKATSAITRAKPSIAGAVPQRIPVGTAFRDAATLQGGFAPGGTITFRIYGPTASGCAGPAYVNTVAIKDNGTVNSDPFVPLRTGRYSFAVSYSGDAENQAASEPCDSPAQVVQVVKRSPKVKPRAVLVGKQISIRARLSGSVSPSGSLTFRLYGPGDTRCRRKPKFSGGVTVKKNGTFSLARYLATKPGIYRLSVGYAGDPRNRRYAGACSAAQPIRVK
jgi:hypothetical protein